MLYLESYGGQAVADSYVKNIPDEKILSVVKGLFGEFESQMKLYDVTYQEVCKIISCFHCSVIYPIYKERYKMGEHPRMLKRHANNFVDTIRNHIDDMIDILKASDKINIPCSEDPNNVA